MEIVSTVAAELALSALSPVIKKLGTYFGGDVTPDEIEHLKVFVLSEILLLIREAKSDDLVKLLPLFEKLQTTALEVDNLLDEYEYKQIKNQVSSSSNNLIEKFIPKFKEMFGCILPKSSLKINLEKMLTIVDQLEKKHPLIITFKTSITQQKYKSPQPTTSIPSSPYFGRKKQYESIINLLLDESHADSDGRRNEVPVIAIRGIGGSGKTLTAQRVCKDNRIRKYFDPLIMWVHVTSDFDVEKLTKKMVESALNKKCPQFTNFDELQKLLIKSMEKQKRFLLVLDDVWCDDKKNWDLLVSPLNEVGGKGSKIIVTTREERVARKLARKEKVINLEELESEDCWSILKYYIFNDPKKRIEDEDMENVGNQIISKTKSSPLALRVVGSSLRDTISVNEWEEILKQNILQETTMYLLSFSYQRLPLRLQRCFAYCSLFPKGYIHKEQLLIPLWIAQGYIENTNDDLTLEEKGSTYIEELLSYSFFEKDSNNDFVIHDLLHELGEKVSNELCHRIEYPRSRNNISAKCIHLSIYTTTKLSSIEISDISKLRNLRSLIILDDAHSSGIFKNNIDIFQKLCKLRVLYVKSDRNMEVLSNLHIDQLKHLRYLHVQYDKKLPESLTKLYHLQFFNLTANCEINQDTNGRECLKPDTLPQGFGNLINLRTLKFIHCDKEVDYLYYNSINIEKLKSLQTVGVFCPEKDSVNGMMPLKNLPLCGSLKVCNLENVKSKEDAEKAMLNRKKNLKELTLEWSSTTSIETCEAVLEGLEPHQNLESLTVRGYQGVKFANWMVKEKKWLRLQTLTLSSCKSIKEINFLPRGLRKLTAEWCDELTQLPPLGNALEELHLINCPALLEDHFRELSSLRILWLQGFTTLPNLEKLRSLETLRIANCPDVETLPNLPDSLKELHVLGSPKLKLKYKRNGSLHKTISHIPRVQIGYI